MADDSTSIEVGSITAAYKIDRTQSVTQVGEIRQEAQEIRNLYGNVTFRLDVSQAIPATQQMIAAATQAKEAYAQAQTSLAAYRAVQVQVAQATLQVREAQVQQNQTVAETRQVQLLAAEAAATYTAALGQQRLATEVQRTAQQEALAVLAQERVATQQLATEKQQLAVRTQELRNAMLEKNIALKDQTGASNSATTAHQALGQSLIGGIARGLEYAVAFQALYAAMNLVHEAITQLITVGPDWEQTMNQLQNNTTLLNSDMGDLSQTILQMGQTTSAPLEQLAESYRHAINEGANLAQATEIVNEAQKSAVSTGANVATTTNLLGSVMHEFANQNLSAAQAMNVLHLAAAQGNLTLEQLVSSSGRAFSQAASLGVALPEVSAALSTLTREGYSASQSATMLSNIMIEITRPTAQAQQEILALSKATGVDLVQDFTQAGLQMKGISGVMADIEKATNGDAKEMFNLITGLRGGRGELVLTTQGASDFNQILTTLNDTMVGKTNPTQDAYNRTVQTAAFQIGQFKNTLHELWIELSTYLLPIIKVVTEELQILIADIAQAAGAPIPSFNQALNQTTDSGEQTTAMLGVLQQGVRDVTQPIDDLSQAAIDASRNLDAQKASVLDLDAKMRDLTVSRDADKASLDSYNEQIKQVTDDYRQQIDPLNAQIKQNNLLTPTEQARKLNELQLQEQEYQIKIDAPDTTAIDQTITDLHTKIDNLGTAATGSLDTQITDIQDKISALGRVTTRAIDQQILDLRTQLAGVGDTTDIDRKIEDLKLQIAAPAPDVTGYNSAAAALQESLTAGTITQSQFQQQFGDLSRQKGQVIDTYTAAQAAAKTQLQILQEQEVVQKRTDEDAKKALNDRIATLERQKAQTAQDNAVQKDALQSQLDSLNDQKKTITDNFNANKADLETQLKKDELTKASMLQKTTDDLAKITRQQDYNKLLDAEAQAHRDVLNFPLKAQADALTEAEKAKIDPLTQQRDLAQAKLDHDNQDLATLKEQKSAIDAQIAAVKAAAAAPPTNNVGWPSNLPGGPPLGGGGAGLTADQQRFLEQNTTTLPSATMNPMVKWADDIRTALETLHTWFDAHKGEIGSDVTNMLNEVGSAIHNAGDVFSAVGSVAEFFFYYSRAMFDMMTGNFAGAVDDFKHMGEGIAGTVAAGMDLSKNVTTGQVANPLNPSGPQVTAPNALNVFDPRQLGQLNSDTSPPVVTMVVESINRVGNALSDLWSKLSGESKVGAQDLSDFSDAVEPIIGPDGRLNTYITSTGTTVTDTWGPGGAWDKGATNAKQTTVDTFGNTSQAQQAIRDYGTTAGQVFGPSGLLHGYTFTDIPTTLGQLKAVIDQHFAPGSGTAVTPIVSYGEFLRSIFGNTGSSVIATLVNTEMPAVFQQMINSLNQHFGDENATAKQPIKTYGDFIKGMFTSGGVLDGYIKLFGPVVDAAMPGDIAPLSGFVKSVGDAIHTIGNIFKIPAMQDFAVPAITYTGGGGGGQNYAAGVSNSALPDHIAWVGERGPELMMVPQGATIIPNNMIPGHQEGLNLDAITPFTLPGAFNPLADYLYAQEQLAMMTLISQQEAARASSGGGSSLFALIPLIKKWAAADGIPADIIAAIILHESGGVIGRHEIQSGGLGRGLMQVDGGTWPQAFDPRMSGTTLADADYQIEIGTMILQRGWDPNDIVQSLRNYSGSGFDSVHGRSFYQELIDLGFLAQADAALAAPVVTGTGGQWGGVVEQAMGHVGQKFQDNGEQWYLWCEKFVNDMDQAAGFAPRRHPTAFLHAISTSLDATSPPPSGASVFFDQSWSNAGHTAVATGSGNQTISTTSHGVDYWDIIGASGYMGWAPPGAQTGTIATSPTILTVGDIPGHVPEIVSPQPMMEQTVMSALTKMGIGGAPTLHMERGAITVDAQGNATVDQSKFTITNGMMAQGMMPQRR